MTTAVDANILLDIVARDSEFFETSRESLSEAALAGPLVISEPVYAEIAAHFTDRDDLATFLADLGVSTDASTPDALHLAGMAWRKYARQRRGLTCASCGARQSVNCDSCGASFARRRHVLADFLIGAHAQVHAGRLLTRDRGYYARYFPELKLI